MEKQCWGKEGLERRREGAGMGEDGDDVGPKHISVWNRTLEVLDH